MAKVRDRSLDDL